ncbi:MAG: metallophosphoesterase [Clostridiales Family XIII bacterium]|jgi:predicted phosphohydrolase|nr:metallophosphoesterase [Clostridiales Family XIII bacterium]
MESKANAPRIFAIADLHLSGSQEKPMDVFGEEWKHHDVKTAENWKAAIGDDDYVIIAGDISWALKFEDALPDLDWIHNLPGKKIITRGNHDLWWHGITKLNKLYDDVRFLQNDHIMVGDTAVCGSRGWLLPGADGYSGETDDRIVARELIRMRLSLDAAMKESPGGIIFAMHFPPAVAPKNRSVFTDLFEQYPVKQVVYGHLHGKSAFKKGVKGEQGGILYRLVSIDYLDFCPVLI